MTLINCMVIVVEVYSPVEAVGRGGGSKVEGFIGFRFYGWNP